MALIPVDEVHAIQIQAGILGRKKGHEFEDFITQKINTFQYPFDVKDPFDLECVHVYIGDPAKLLLNYVAYTEGLHNITSATAVSTGALATSEEGKKWLLINGITVSRCKSDLVITIEDDVISLTKGISIKQCNNKISTNAQLYFTTALAFSKLLQCNGIAVSDDAIFALRQFCGDEGFRPSDNPAFNKDRKIDPRRYFWEEINAKGRTEWENIFSTHQDDVSRLLFQKAYLNDPFTPDYLLHKTKKSSGWQQTEVAIYSIDELVTLSLAYQGLTTKSYSVKKGSYKDPHGTTHQAPRFGIIQMQRGGQKQHPTQLQFNLEAGYFYKI